MQSHSTWTLEGNLQTQGPQTALGPRTLNQSRKASVMASKLCPKSTTSQQPGPNHCFLDTWTWERAVVGLEVPLSSGDLHLHVDCSELNTPQLIRGAYISGDLLPCFPRVNSKHQTRRHQDPLVPKKGNGATKRETRRPEYCSSQHVCLGSQVEMFNPKQESIFFVYQLQVGVWQNRDLEEHVAFFLQISL